MIGAFKRTFIALCAVLALSLMACAYLLGTQQGTRLLLDKLQQYAPGDLSIGGIDGHFFDMLTLQKVQWHLQGRSQSIDTLYWAWQPAALLDGALRILALRASGVHLDLPPAPTEAAAAEPAAGWHPPALPLDILLGELRIEDLHIASDTAETRHIALFSLSGHLRGGRLQLSELRLNADQGSLKGQLQGGLAAPFPVEGAIDWSANLSDGITAQGRLTLAGDAQHLRLRQRGSAALPITLDATLSDLTSASPGWAVELSWPAFTLPPALTGGALALRPGRLDSRGDLRDYRLTLQAGHTGGGIPDADWTLTARGNSERLTIERLTGQLLGGELDIDGQANWSEGVRTELTLRGRDLDLSALHAELPARVNARARLDAGFADNRLNVPEILLSLEQPAAELAFRGSLDIAPPDGPLLDGRLRWSGLQWPLQAAQPMLSSAQGSGRLSGKPDAYALELDSELTAPSVGPGQWHLSAAGDRQRVDIRQLHARLLDGTLAIQGSIQHQPRIVADLSFEARQLALSGVLPDWPAAARAQATGRINLDDRQLRLDDVRLEIPASDSRLTLQAEGRLAPDVLASALSADLQWHGLRWPLLQPAMLSSPRGRVRLSGQPQAYRIDLEAAVDGARVPEGSWRLAATGTSQGLQLQPLEGRLLDGVLQARGSIDWAPRPSWKLALEGDGLNPAGYAPDWPGQLSLRAETDGHIAADGQPSARLTLQRIDGLLKGLPLNLSGQFVSAQGSHQLQTLSLSSGDNRLRANGSLTAERVDLKWDIRVPDPSALLAGAAGDVQLSGSLTGSSRAPTLDSRLSAKALSLDGLRLQALAAQLRARLHPHGELDLQLQADQLSADAKPLITRLTADAAGHLDQHRLTIGVTAPQGELDSELDGGIDLAAKHWSGLLQRFSASAARTGRWQLETPAALLLGAEQLRLDSACLRQQGQSASACLALARAGSGHSRLDARLSDLSLDLFAPEVSGRLSAELHGELDPAGGLRGSAEADLTPGQIKVLVEQRERILPHQGGRLRATIDQQGLSGQLRVFPLERGSIEADVHLPELVGLALPQRQPISGRLRADLPDLSLLQAFMPQLSNTQGRLAGDVRVSGELPQPRVDGQFGLQQGAVDIAVAGLLLRDIELSLAADPQQPSRLILSGGARSGDGRIDLRGYTETNTGHSQLHLYGKDFDALNTADAVVRIAPDLRMDWQGERLRLRGQLEIPQAAITPQLDLGNRLSGSGAEALDSAGTVIEPSPDVVVLNPESDTAPTRRLTQPPLPIDAELDIVLGDQVRIDAAGFKTRLTGRLTLLQKPGRNDPLPLGKGTLNLEEGSFRSFGQDLQIEWGRITFDRVPINEPELDIRAVRWIKNDERVTAAGLRLLGTPTDPSLELFSRPPLDAQTVQFYLLTGRAPDDQERLLSIGTQLSDDVYVGYGINLLERTHEFNLRYDLLRWLGLDVDVGEADKSLNLNYTWER